MKTVLLAVLLVTLVHADPPFPKWAQHFQQQFVESYVDAPHFHTEGFMWYDATLQMSRIQRNNGKMDRVCGSVLINLLFLQSAGYRLATHSSVDHLPEHSPHLLLLTLADHPLSCLVKTADFHLHNGLRGCLNIDK